MDNYFEIISGLTESKSNEVGIKFEQEKLKVIFPHGYLPSDNKDFLKRDICLLISCFEKFNNRKNNNIVFNNPKNLNQGEGYSSFPFTSAFWILDHFQKNGLFKEHFKENNVKSKGKVDWKKTIKHITPYPYDNTFMYDKFIVEESSELNTDITKIQKYCISRSYQVLGWIFPSLNINSIEEAPFTQSKSLNILHKGLITNNNDKTKLLITHLIKLIKLDSSDLSSKIILNELYTANFEYIWEDMIYFSLNNVNITDYYPKASWNIKDRVYQTSSLIPDTILSLDNVSHIIDAKYYKYGKSKNINDLPQTSDIIKQLSYEDFIKEKFITETTNSFIIPGNLSDNVFEIFGYAKFIDEDLRTINGIIVDTKTLINLYLGYSPLNLRTEFNDTLLYL